MLTPMRNQLKDHDPSCGASTRQPLFTRGASLININGSVIVTIWLLDDDHDGCNYPGYNACQINVHNRRYLSLIVNSIVTSS